MNISLQFLKLLNHTTEKTELFQPKKSDRNSLFEETSYRAFSTASRRRLTVFVSFFLVLTLIVGFVVYEQLTKKKQESIAAEYGAIDTIFNQETNRSLPSSPSENKAMSTANHSESSALFVNFANKYKTDPYGWQAALRAANYYIEKEDYTKAQQPLETILPFSHKISYLQIKIKTVLAGIYFLEKDTTKALSELESVEKIPNNPILNQTQFFKAQLLYSIGQKDTATQILSKLSTNPIFKNNPMFKNFSFSGNEKDPVVTQAKLWLNFVSFL